MAVTSPQPAAVEASSVTPSASVSACSLSARRSSCSERQSSTQRTGSKAARRTAAPRMTIPLGLRVVRLRSRRAQVHGWAVGGLFAGYLIFVFGDGVIDRLAGSDRKDASGGQEGGSPLAIALGDGARRDPRVIVIGRTIFEGGAVGAVYLAAVFISNLPEAIVSTSGHVARWLRPGFPTGHRRVVRWFAAAAILTNDDAEAFEHAASWWHG